MPESGSLGSTTLIIKGTSGEINHYVVTISGEDIVSPIEKEIGADATNATIDGIPVGEQRSVTVAAYNGDGKKVREGEVGDIVIRPALITDVAITLDTVPIFVNLEDGRVIPADRLVFHLLSDPEDQLMIENETAAGPSPLVNASTGLTKIKLDTSSGSARWIPNQLALGEHRLTLRSLVTGRSSTANIRVVEPTSNRPAPLFSAGTLAERADQAQLSRIGGYYESPRMLWRNE